MNVLCFSVVSQRAAERDARKAKAKEKKLHGEKEALLGAIKVCTPFSFEYLNFKTETIELSSVYLYIADSHQISSQGTLQKEIKCIFRNV